ncbi:phage minor head protein [Vibrio parahaemolyticus]|nr:phage minor head protein [Vibrio parahaemolyticus]MCR9657278.1 phage minor head protein [Vibrio parahaemolyticus]
MDDLVQQVKRYLLSKGISVTFDWEEMLEQEHDFNFTVAKMTELDMLTDTQLLVTQAITEGMTYQQFASLLKPMLIKKGWWGKQVMVDPWSDEEREVQLGSDKRIRTIYETNMRTARAYGQYQRTLRTSQTLPYYVYELGPSRVHRKEHLKWAGLMLPVDDPFWETHYPPNGWGCKCRLRQVSQWEYERLQRDGLTERVQELDESGMPTGRFTTETVAVKTTAPPIDMQQYVNKRTGEVSFVPEGIDPGWAYHPKYRRQALDKEMAQKEAAYDKAARGNQ